MNHNIFYGLIAIVAILSVMNLAFVTNVSQSAAAVAAKTKEDARPADIEVIKLSDSSCTDCFDIGKVLSELKNKNFKVLKEESVNPFSDNGKELVNKFGIKKLPILIVSGEVKKSSIENYFKGNWELKENNGKNYAVYTDVLPPYQDTKGEVIGRVSLTRLIDSSCDECSDFSFIVSALKQNGGVVFSPEKTLEYKTPEAQELINRLRIERVPAIIVSKNILEYPEIQKVWNQLNAVEKQGLFVLPIQDPPYRDIKTGEVKGLVKITYLNDSSCKQCFDVKSVGQILARIGIVVTNKTEIDASSEEGKELVKKYNIQKVPIVILSPETKDYEGFVSEGWPQVGSVEPDGWFVMRKPEVIGNYKDLATGKEVVKSQQQPRK